MDERRLVEQHSATRLKQQVAEQQQLADSNGTGNEFINAVRICRFDGLDECSYFHLLVVHLVELVEQLLVVFKTFFDATNLPRE